MADTYRFDPHRSLSPAELTEVLREVLPLFSEAMVTRLQTIAPTVARHVVKNEAGVLETILGILP